MARNPDIPCAVCGTLIWRGSTSLPPGKATCRLCRKKRAAPKPERKDFGWRVCQGCGSEYEARTHNQKFCHPDCRPNRFRFIEKKKSSTQRGYGTEHRKLREEWRPAVEAGLAPCSICGHRIAPDDSWHLDHTPDRTGYRGPAHASCNRKDGASRAARRGNASRTP